MIVKKLKLIKYDDPGHGWLRVKRKDIEALGIADQITRFSYQRGSWVYLEEDQDVGTFIQAAGDISLEVKYKHNNRGSKIRTYESYKYKGEIK